MSSLHERLDKIWDNAKPCQCGNDDNWSQDIKGSIRCNQCGEDVTLCSMEKGKQSMNTKHIKVVYVRGEVNGLLEAKVYLNDCPYESTPLPVSIQELKDKGVIQNKNGLRKAENWLNSNEGKKFVVEKINQSFDWVDEMK